MELLLAKISIRKKLTIVIMLVSLLVLVLVAGIFISIEIYSSQNHLVMETKTLADSLGANLTQPLLLNDIPKSNNLLASLKRKPGVRAAYLFDAKGTPVASYLDQSDSQFLLKSIPEDFPDPSLLNGTDYNQERIVFSWSHMSLFLPLLHEGKRIGILYLLSDLKDLFGRVSGVVFGALLSLLFMLLPSWYLAGKLQRPVSRPLIQLVATMGAVSREKNYRLRANKETEDEIGDLVDGFNRMLGVIELHRDQLEKHQETLEQTVAQRTEELRGMIQALNQSKWQLESAGKAKSEFIANITHELRTPLIGVLGMNELLFRTPLNTEQQGLAGMVTKSGNDLLLLVNNILDFSRMEAGKLKLEPVEFDIHQVIESVLEMLAGQAEEKGLLLLGELPLETAWKVRGDEIRLKQILVNLVGNAIKFTHRGEVKVSLAWQKKKASLGEFELQIRDTGIGMDVTAQEQVFSAFFQADNTSTRDYGGSGLGLAIVAQLVDLMGGRISLTSTPDEGSCFRIMLELPLEEQADLSLPEELLRQRVLLCTDRIPPFDQLAARLTSLGMPALIVPSAVETWYQLGAAVRAGKPFELLFCSPDTCLPTGQPLYQGLREDPMFRQLRRILLPPSRFANLSLGRHETKLTPPLVWKDLIQALRTSWQDLHLIDKPRGEKSTRSNSLPAAEEIKDRLLVVGGGVASRELVKLALQNSSCLVESAPDLSDLTIHSSKDYAAILFDLPFLPEGQLKHFFAEKDIHSKILIFYEFEEQIEPYRAWIHVFLKKPFDRKQLQGALEALFSDRVLTHSSKLEGPG